MKAQRPNDNERACGTCSLCCKLMEVETLSKPAGRWCGHCVPSKGCSIHATRPDECRGFYCGWLRIPELGEEWKPQQAKFLLFLSDDSQRLNAVVDPSAPDAWRRQPFYGQFKTWARQSVNGGPNVQIWIRRRCVAILPDRDVELGVVPEGDGIYFGMAKTPAGPKFIARVIPGTPQEGGKD